MMATNFMSRGPHPQIILDDAQVGKSVLNPLAKSFEPKTFSPVKEESSKDETNGKSTSPDTVPAAEDKKDDDNDKTNKKTLR